MPPVPLSSETARRLEALFHGSDRETARVLLVNECAANLPLWVNATESGLERIRYAVLKLSSGDPAELKRAVKQAQVDWRDVLVAAGFAHDTRVHEEWFQMTELISERGTNLAPMLSVRRGLQAVDFYKAAFGARELFRIEHDGSVVAQLAVGNAKFWVADESPEHLNYSPETLEGSTARMVLVVADPAGVFARVIAAGARQIWPVREENGWLIGRAVDPFGHHWEIGRPLKG